VINQMDVEELRPLVLEAINIRSHSSFQIVDLINSVEELARKKGVYPQVTQYKVVGASFTRYMPGEDREKVRQIIWFLILEGVLVPGSDEFNASLPFLRVTDYGRKCLEAGEILPHDPEGYIEKLRQQVPGIDETIVIYVTEALQTFLRGNFLASAVMLGVASERAILLLIEAFMNSISNPEKRRKIQKKTEQTFSILKRFELFRKNIEPLKNVLRNRVADDLDIILDGIFNLIRITRNDAGHPTGKKIDRTQAFANLRLFIPYCKRIYELIDYFQKNPTEL
jgi:hypothetical protein